MPSAATWSAPPATFNAKICLLGDAGVGKSSLIHRFIHAGFCERMSPLRGGVKVSRKTLGVVSSAGVVELSMLLWDLAGGEEFDQSQASYLRGSAGAILVCDVTRPPSVANLGVYVREAQRRIKDPKLILAANKVDLVEEAGLHSATVQAAAEKLGIPLLFTSAKSGQGVDDLFRALGSMVMGAQVTIIQQEEFPVDLWTP